MKNTDGTMHSSYQHKLKYPLCFTVTYVQLVTEQYKSRTANNCLKSNSVIKVATMEITVVMLRKLAHATTKSIVIIISNDEWDIRWTLVSPQRTS